MKVEIKGIGGETTKDVQGIGLPFALVVYGGRLTPESRETLTKIAANGIRDDTILLIEIESLAPRAIGAATPVEIGVEFVQLRASNSHVDGFEPEDPFTHPDPSYPPVS